jgi:hypothetical protein
MQKIKKWRKKKMAKKKKWRKKKNNGKITTQ